MLPLPVIARALDLHKQRGAGCPAELSSLPNSPERAAVERS